MLSSNGANGAPGRRSMMIWSMSAIFPPNAGAAGTAAYLSVFESLHNTLTRMKDEGYTLDLPANVDDLRAELLKGNAEKFGQPANVAAIVSVEDILRETSSLSEIEAV